jgi:ABC-2 type transport system ATP-binding protein
MRSSTPAPAIETTGLRKMYGGTCVLDGVDLAVAPGTVFALLGPNGAGKTTIVQILSTLRAFDGGQARVMGYDPRRQADAVRASIGVTGQFSAVDAMLTGQENLLLMGGLHHLGRHESRRRTAELLARFELADSARRPPSTYSGGMRRRLDIAMTLMGNPRLLFLDEPTTGLDPRGRHTMWRIIRELVDDGVTVFLTTQYLDEADRLADRIAVLDHGRVVAEGTAAELKRRTAGAHILLRFASPADLDAAASTIGEGVRDGHELTLRVPGEPGARYLRNVLQRIGDAVNIEDITIHTPDLDDVFLALTAAGQEVAR